MPYLLVKCWLKPFNVQSLFDYKIHACQREHYRVFQNKTHRTFHCIPLNTLGVFKYATFFPSLNTHASVLQDFGLFHWHSVITPERLVQVVFKLIIVCILWFVSDRLCYLKYHIMLEALLTFCLDYAQIMVVFFWIMQNVFQNFRITK